MSNGRETAHLGVLNKLSMINCCSVLNNTTYNILVNRQSGSTRELMVRGISGEMWSRDLTAAYVLVFQLLNQYKAG